MMGFNVSVAATSASYGWLWGYLLPLGLLMLFWGGLESRKARRVTSVAAAAVALAALGYWAVGFAFHMGGAYAVNPEEASLQGLQILLSVVPGDPGWGVVGLAGFFLSGSAASSSITRVFLTYLPLVATAVLLVALALAQTRRWLMVSAGLLMGAVVMPIAACWTWGSGWLSHLGQTLELGHGFVDFGGSTLVLWLPSVFVLPILVLQPRELGSGRPTPPATYAPFVSNVGALFMGFGWLGWVLSNPFHIGGAVLDWNRTATSVLLGMGGAVVTSQLYAWLMLGRPEALLASQGLGAGWGAVLGCAPFLPPWAALIVGLLAGLLFPLVHYGLRAGLRIQDSASAVALGLVSGPLSLIGLVLLADGRWGQGWNRIGAPVEGVTAGVGVGNIFAMGTGQLAAQLFGLGALGLWGLLWGGLLGLVASPRFAGRRSAMTVPTEQMDVVESEPDERPLPRHATPDQDVAKAPSDGADTAVSKVADSVPSASGKDDDDPQVPPLHDISDALS
jgi:Amt family ammonium transporter